MIVTMNNKRNTEKYFTYDNDLSNNLLINEWIKSDRFEKVEAVSVFFCDFRESFFNILKSLSRGGERRLTVVGCVAWLSDPQVIDELAKYCENVFLIVNDEDFSSWGNGKTHLLYDRLPWCKRSLCKLFSHLSDSYIPMKGEGTFAPVRTIEKTYDSHLMHNKYVIFMLRSEQTGLLQCESVWMGSVNFTKNSLNNLESSVYMEDGRVAKAFFNDFTNLFLLSRPLMIRMHTDSVHEDMMDNKRKRDEFEYCTIKKRHVYKGEK